ncbi:MAG: aspartate kinase [Clostridiales bacterium]|nr:aspartate kinase [Clostridiales bacterium]
MAIKVCKFGGTSMAAGNVIRSVKGIIESDKERRFIVVSAPGKRYSGDVKVTDMLYACHSARDREELKKLFAPVRNRFINIIKELNLNFQIDSLLDETEQQIFLKKQEDFTASRGEYICGVIMAEVLGAKFIDAKDVIFFKADGTLNDEKTYKSVAAALSGVPSAVISGFYGTGADGNIKTFSRGGSDISGAIVARAVNASIYENWTDVSGFLACDPRIVDSPKRIKQISYKEFRELSYMGADLLHSESVFPVRKANIPILIKNTFRPQDEGTTILPTSRYLQSGAAVTGIAGKKNFTVIFIEKANMNSEVGFMCNVLKVLSDENVSIEHIPSGIDTISLIIDRNQLEGKLERVIEGIKRAVSPDTVRVSEDVALIATVGYGMSSSIGTSARLFGAIAGADINIKIINQGSSEINIIVGVRNEDYEKCIRAIYGEFFN